MNSPPRIIDVVFERRAERRWPLWLGGLAAALLHVAVIGLTADRERSLASWSAELSVAVHQELTQTREVEFPEPPPPTEMAAPPAEAKPEPAQPRPLRLRTPTPAPAPAAASRALTAPTSTPVDLTQQTLIVGQTATSLGGVTLAGATGATVGYGDPPGSGPASDTEAGPGRSRPVQLAQAEWRCPWPAAADEALIDAQTATIAVWVDAEGTVLDTRIVHDPGYGFGAAAQRCAQKTRFSPARDRKGQPIRAWSPAIRVHFSR